MDQLFDYQTAALLIRNFHGTTISLWEDADDNLQLRLEFELGLALPLSAIDRFRAFTCEGRKSIAIVNRNMGLEWTAPIEDFASGETNLGWHSWPGKLGPINL